MNMASRTFIKTFDMKFAFRTIGMKIISSIAPIIYNELITPSTFYEGNVWKLEFWEQVQTEKTPKSHDKNRR